MPRSRNKQNLNTAEGLLLSLTAEERALLQREVNNKLYEAELHRALADLRQGHGITFSPEAWTRYLAAYHI
ncbi:MAG: hypothetical protein IAF08_01475 [Rhizobacter sp.]|nr:hypothetical protein [Chlorobiales bacterium]